ncbi:hypothetical protein K456DRAFT_39131 [Colletotrichum gloeosporioides 23]|nr:hypothetical protein K456DRAFT_39131 [Colletotrichum gloeosporioides 23]
MSKSRQPFNRDRDSSSEGEPVRSTSPAVTSIDGLNLGLEAKEGNGWLRNKVAPAMCYGIATAGLIAVGLPVLISTPAIGVAGIAAHSVTASKLQPLYKPLLSAHTTLTITIPRKNGLEEYWLKYNIWHCGTLRVHHVLQWCGRRVQHGQSSLDENQNGSSRRGTLVQIRWE